MRGRDLNGADLKSDGGPGSTFVILNLVPRLYRPNLDLWTDIMASSPEPDL